MTTIIAPSDNCQDATSVINIAQAHMPVSSNPLLIHHASHSRQIPCPFAAIATLPISSTSDSSTSDLSSLATPNTTNR